MSKLRVEIRILNPPQGTRPVTSLSRAARYVKQRRADWGDATHTTLRFVAHDPRHQAVVRQVDATERGYDLAANRGGKKLDELLEMARHIPITRATMALGMGQAR